MQHYATVDAEGKLIRFYQDDICGIANIPDTAVAITEKQWAAWAKNQNNYRLINNEMVQINNLLAIKKEAIFKLNQACNTAIRNNFSSTTLGAIYNYPNKNTDQLNLLTALTHAALPNNASNWTSLLWCVDIDNIWAMRPHTAQQIQQVAIDSKTAINNNQLKLAQLTQQINAANNTEEINAIIW
jgi:hypothetical protein